MEQREPRKIKAAKWADIKAEAKQHAAQMAAEGKIVKVVVR